jgi:signal transduction histidine kinase
VESSSQESLDRLRSEVADLRASRERLVLAADAERRGFERGLHDGPQQRLTALSVRLQLARDLVHDDPDAARALLDELGGDVQRALDETAKLAERIFPPLLGAAGLAASLRAAAMTTGARAKIEVGAVDAAPPELVAAVYFCCLEVLRRAGDGARVTIDVGLADGSLAFLVEGAKADPALDHLCDRIEALGGRLTVDAEPGSGIRVSGSLPVSR